MNVACISVLVYAPPGTKSQGQEDVRNKLL